jgi:hypothetical protein
MMLSTEEYAAKLREAMPWAEVRVTMDEVLVTCPPERQKEAVKIICHNYEQIPLTCGIG